MPTVIVFYKLICIFLSFVSKDKCKIMTFTWIRDANAKEKPTAPNNPIFGLECEIPISLVCKGPKDKNWPGFLWRLVQQTNPRMGPGSPTNSVRQWRGRDGRMEGRLEGWEPGKFRLSNRKKVFLFVLSLTHRLSRSQRSVCITIMRPKMTMTRVWTL